MKKFILGVFAFVAGVSALVAMQSSYDDGRTPAEAEFSRVSGSGSSSGSGSGTFSTGAADDSTGARAKVATAVSAEFSTPRQTQ